MRVLLGWQADERELERAKQMLPSCTVSAVPAHESLTRFDCDARQLAKAAEEADVLATFTFAPLAISRAPNLKLIAWLHSGFDPVDLDLLKARGIALTNVAGANATAVAEHAFALLLGLGKRIVERDRRVKAGRWAPFWSSDTSSSLFAGSTLAIVGLGEVGNKIAQRARSFEMKTVGVRRSGLPSTTVDTVVPPSQLEKALAQAQFVVLCVPLTDETYHLIDRRAFEAMPRGTYLVNVCRGGVVDEQALHRALESGRLAGYASDVWWTYPNSMPEGWHYAVPSRLGIHLRDDTVASHDSSVDNLAVKDAMIYHGLRNIQAFIAGQQLPTLVFDGSKLVGSLSGMDSRTTID